jgi:hypothetical protein
MTVARRARAGIIVPRRVPTVSVEIDWTHPLSNGLVACYMPGSLRGAVDLTGIGPFLAPVSSAAVIGPTSYGPGLVSDASAASIGSSAVPAAWKLATAGTIFSALELTGTPVASTSVFGLAYNSSGTTPFNDYLLFFDSSTRLGFAYNHGGTSASVQSLVAMGSGRHTAAATFTISNTAPIVIYQDGAATFTGAWSGVSPSYAGGGYLQIGGDISVPTRILHGNTAISLIYNRVLSAAEIAALNIDPFCMLRPSRQTAFRRSGTAAALQASAKLAFRAKGNGPALTTALSGRAKAQLAGRPTGPALSTALSGTVKLAFRGPAAAQFVAALTGRAGAKVSMRSAPVYAVALVGRSRIGAAEQGSLLLLSVASLQTNARLKISARGALSLTAALRSTSGIQVRGLAVPTSLLALSGRSGIRIHGRPGLHANVLLALAGGKAGIRLHGRATFTITPFIPSQNVINIGFPQRGLPIADPKTGVMDQNWYLFFHALWKRGGGPIGN